jgi:hypothetical protein
MMNPKDSGARIEVGRQNTIAVVMEDLLKAEKIALEKVLEEEMAVARMRKPVCFQKTRTGMIKKIVPAVMTTMTTAPTITSNLTPEELDKLIDMSVTSKYGANLTQFTRIIADDMRNTLESFKTDLHNTLPRQVRSVVQ